MQKNGEEVETVVIFFDCERAPSVFPFRVPPLLNTNRVVYITTPMQASNYERFFTSSYFCADSLSGSTVEFFVKVERGFEKFSFRDTIGDSFVLILFRVVRLSVCQDIGCLRTYILELVCC